MTSSSQTSGEFQLDIRSVEPKNRFERIMGLYNRLSPGETLDLIVDHDPKCMYYTLEAEHGPETFSFEYLDDGPEVWRVHVEKKKAVDPAGTSADG